MIISLDCETTKKPKHLPWLPDSYLVSIHMCRSDGTTKSWLINHPESTQTQEECQHEIQAEINAATKVVAHNLKFDINWFHLFGLDLSGTNIYCTFLAEYVLRNFNRLDGLSLGDLSTYYGIPEKIDKVKMYWDSGYETDEIPADILIPYGEQDCINALAIYNQQIPQIIERNQGALISLEMESIRGLAEAEMNGMLLDVDTILDLAQDYAQQVYRCDVEMQKLLGEDISLSSPDQRSAAIYGGTFLVDGVEETRRTLKSGEVKIGSRKCKVPRSIEGLGIKPLPNTETKKPGIYKTDAPTLMQLKATTKSGKAFLRIYKERSKLHTMLGTFFYGLLKRVQADDRVHPSINQTITKTSRLSCSNPNLQNQPRGNTGPIKKSFITRY